MNTFTAINVYLHARFVQFVDTFIVNHDLSNHNIVIINCMFFLKPLKEKHLTKCL